MHVTNVNHDAGLQNGLQPYMFLLGTFACLVVTINYRIRVSTRMLSQGGCNSAGRIPPLTHHHLISLEKVPTKTIAMKIVQKLKSL
jgi:hypothetical protein